MCTDHKIRNLQQAVSNLTAIIKAIIIQSGGLIEVFDIDLSIADDRIIKYVESNRGTALSLEASKEKHESKSD